MPLSSRPYSHNFHNFQCSKSVLFYFKFKFFYFLFSLSNKTFSGEPSIGRNINEGETGEIFKKR